MPKYFTFKVAGYFLYFTAHCVIEPIHTHASDARLSEGGSAKIWVKENGDTTIANHGAISHRNMSVIRQFIKDNIDSIKKNWVDFAGYVEFLDQ